MRYPLLRSPDPVQAGKDAPQSSLWVEMGDASAKLLAAHGAANGCG